MIAAAALAALVAASVYFGYLFGVRVERERRASLDAITAETRKTGGVRLRRISVRR